MCTILCWGISSFYIFWVIILLFVYVWYANFSDSLDGVPSFRDYCWSSTNYSNASPLSHMQVCALCRSNSSQNIQERKPVWAHGCHVLLFYNIFRHVCIFNKTKHNTIGLFAHSKYINCVWNIYVDSCFESYNKMSLRGPGGTRRYRGYHIWNGNSHFTFFNAI